MPSGVRPRGSVSYKFGLLAAGIVWLLASLRSGLCPRVHF